MNPKYCSKCGTLHYEEGNLCSNCKKMGVSENIVKPSNQYQGFLNNNNNNNLSNPEKKNIIWKKLPYKWIFFVVGIIIIALVLFLSLFNNKEEIKSALRNNDYSWSNPFAFENIIYNDQGNKLLNIVPEEVIEYGQLFLVKEKKNDYYDVYKINGEIIQGLKVKKPLQRYDQNDRAYILNTDSTIYFYDENMRKMYETEYQDSAQYSVSSFGDEENGYIYEINANRETIYWKNGKIIQVRAGFGEFVEDNYIQRGDYSIDYVDKEGNIITILTKEVLEKLGINLPKTRGFYLNRSLTIPYNYYIFNDINGNVTIFNDDTILFKGTMQTEKTYYLLKVHKDNMLIVQKNSDLIEYYKNFKLVKTFDNTEYSMGNVMDFGFYIESRNTGLRDYYDWDGKLIASSVDVYAEENEENYKIVKINNKITIYYKDRIVYSCNMNPKSYHAQLIKKANSILLECEDKNLMIHQEKVEKEYSTKEKIYKYAPYDKNKALIQYPFPTSVVITVRYEKKKPIYTLYNIDTGKKIEENTSPEKIGPNQEVLVFSDKQGHTRIYNNQLELILEK